MINLLPIFFLALVLAALEVQIEGRDGWAKNLPTWRPDKNKWYGRLYSRLTFDKELTGYHLLLSLLVLGILHYPYFAGAEWSGSAELRTFSSLFLLFVAEDFLWFVLNPNFGLKRFRPRYAPWHKKWLFFLPADYWAGLIVSVFLYFAALFYGR